MPGSHYQLIGMHHRQIKFLQFSALHTVLKLFSTNVIPNRDRVPQRLQSFKSIIII